MGRIILKTFILILGTTLAVKINTFLDGKGVEEVIALLLSIALSVAIVYLAEFVLITIPYRFRILRIIFDPVHTIEGYWYEHVISDTHPYSYACIEYDPLSETFKYSGQNFTTEFTLNATFKSERITIHKASREISFHFTAHVHRPNRDDMQGYSRIAFFSDGKRSFTRGQGSFTEPEGQNDTDIIMKDVTIFLEKIPYSFVRYSIKKRKIHNNDDVRKLIQAFVQDRDGQNMESSNKLRSGQV